MAESQVSPPDIAGFADRWTLRDRHPEAAQALAAAAGLRPLTAQLLVQRGITDPDAAIRFLQPKLSHMRTPDGPTPIADFDKAVARILAAMVAGEPIGVFGDYDADGVTSAALLASYLGEATSPAQIIARAASRSGGYGLQESHIEEFLRLGCQLIITCDLGTSDFPALQLAASRHADVIVVDHHQVPADDGIRPYALLNSHRRDCQFPYKGLASVGVALYLVGALRTRLEKQGWSRIPAPRDFLDLVAIGTVADQAPLTDENRILVRGGLQQLSAPRRPGVAALCRLARLEQGVRKSTDIGMRLAPRINAPGRIGEAQLALDLLRAPTQEEADRLVTACETANQTRQKIQEKILREARDQAAEILLDKPRVLVLWGEDWHPGVVGIIAAKMVEQFSLPTFVIGFDGTGPAATGRGSGRSYNNIDLVALLRQSQSLLIRSGGHAAAAGFSIRRDMCEAFRQRVNEVCPEPASLQPKQSVDACVTLAEMDEVFLTELLQFEPFGRGNPEPVLALCGAVMKQARTVGNGHLQARVSEGGFERPSIGFGLAKTAPPVGAEFGALVFPEWDFYRGFPSMRVRLIEWSEETHSADEPNDAVVETDGNSTQTRSV